MHRSLACLLIPTIFATSVWAADLPPAVDRSVDFISEIQPLLKKHCIACHGSEKQESGLRLDRADLALAGGDSGKAIVVGKSEQSRLVHYVAGIDPDHVMPPEGDRLSPQEIGLLRTWIDRGAIWPADAQSKTTQNTHWAYQPLLKAVPPKVSGVDSVRNPIDQFVLAKLESIGLSLSPEADRATLIRRLTLDLLGLLPSIEEVDAFVNDPHPNAYQQLVDRLLDSPHFGERWGRHWLDMARYADSDGYEKDNPRPDAYRYRDWVIDAINEDMPYDQFTIEQLAGDLLPDATPMQKLATAFHRQTLTNTEGGTDQEQFRVEACFDRTETTGAVWLGLTIGCARCHTHKYDAITQREYYQLFAFFNNGDEQTTVVPKSVSEVQAYQLELDRYTEKVAAIKSELTEVQAKLKDDFIAWEQQMRAKAAELGPEGLNRKPFKAASIQVTGVDPSTMDKVKFASQKDGSVLVSGDNPDSATYLLVGKSNSDFDTVRLDVLADASLPAKGPGRVAHGNFVLSELALELADNEAFDNPVQLKFDEARADHEQQGKPWLAKHAIDGNLDSGWAIGSEYGKNHWAEFRLQAHTHSLKDKHLRIRLVQQYGKQHTIGRFKLSLQRGFEPDVNLPDSVVKLLQISPDQRTKTQQENLFNEFSRQSALAKPLHDKLDALAKQAPARPEVNARVFVQRVDKPRETFVLRRGEFLEPISDAKVAASGLSVLPTLSPRQASVASDADKVMADRLDLARWLVSSENPLTPRVTVNHVWQTLFGTGLVKTANDFGVRGERPTHPELLDWLAAEFIGLHGQSSLGGRPAWSRKGLIKLIVMSSTYRQSSRVNPAAYEIRSAKISGCRDRIACELKAKSCVTSV